MAKTAFAHLRVVPVPFQLLVDHGLTPNQWCLLYLMHFKYDLEQLAYLTGDNAPQGWNPDELNDLHDRFYLIYEPRSGDHPKLSPINFRVSERFTDLLGETNVVLPPPYKLTAPLPAKKWDSTVRAQPSDVLEQKPVIPGLGLDALEAFDELFGAYPSHIDVNGTLMSGRSGDYEHMAASYGKLLDSKQGRQGPSHVEILELVAWAKENALIKMGLAKFISGREWLGLNELRESGFNNNGYSNQEAI